MTFADMDLSSAIARPAGLDEHLVATTGCSSREIATILAAGPDRAAHALAPFLGDQAPAHGELARAIAADPNAIPMIAGIYSVLEGNDAVGAVAPATIVASEDNSNG